LILQAGGEGEKKKNPYAVIQGNFQGENFQTKMQEQASCLHEHKTKKLHVIGTKPWHSSNKKGCM
jgi:hypothetical protein